jgi:hypothetical protein
MGARAAALIVLSLVLASGCKDDPPVYDDAGLPDDAAPIDASTVQDARPDAMPDAMIEPPDAAPPAPGQELTGAAGRVTSPSYVLDVQVGHGAVQSRTQSSSYRLEGNAPVKP